MTEKTIDCEIEEDDEGGASAEDYESEEADDRALVDVLMEYLVSCHKADDKRVVKHDELVAILRTLGKDASVCPGGERSHQYYALIRDVREGDLLKLHRIKCVQRPPTGYRFLGTSDHAKHVRGAIKRSWERMAESCADGRIMLAGDTAELGPPIVSEIYDLAFSSVESAMAQNTKQIRALDRWEDEAVKRERRALKEKEKVKELRADARKVIRKAKQLGVEVE